MVYFPVRKCYQAAKITLLVILVVTVLALFEQWRGGKRNAAALYSDSTEAEYERQILEDEARIIPGLGEGGVAAHLMGEEKKLGEESEKKLAINVYLSDRIPYNRTLKDFRNPACQRVVYDAELPSASVIIIFHNEPYSVVVRTLWSVVNSARRSNPWFKHANFVDQQTGRVTNMGYPGQDQTSPFVYLKEIVLVDDNSTLPELKGKLSHYIRTRLPPDLIRILRLPDRIGLTQARMAGAKVAVSDVMIFLDAHCEGNTDWLRPLLHRIKEKKTAVLTPLIDVIEQKDFLYQHGDVKEFEVGIGLTRARLAGARYAAGDVLVFLDSHCEAQPDWLRPLLAAIKERPHAVVVPIIDVIETSNFYYSVGEISTFQVGGFTFMGHFTWTEVPEREKKRRGSDIGPTWSPTMAGGLFAISREYFWELGAYDEQMAGWGGENLEMSFRIWQCGGTLETIPCSRVGHVFRAFHPYGLPASSDTHGINTARMAEVWMDEYAELFYLHRPDLRNNPRIGDVTHRRVLRDKLKCKSFQWYLDNVYREKFVPVRDVYGYGRFKNEATQLCLDTLQREGDQVSLGAYPCHSSLQATQYFSLSNRGEIRDETDCASVQHTRVNPEERGKAITRPVVMSTCHGKGREQKWVRLPSGQLRHTATALCLTAPRAVSDVTATLCDPELVTQLWKIDYNEDNDFKLTSDEEALSEERDRRISKLRGQRSNRISRSLLSYPDNALDDTPFVDNTTVRRHTHKSKHHKRHGHKAKHSAKKRIKNKFILKIVRTLMNGTDEHLEVDIHCKHKQLYPNNTFVRDLVTILNDRNIKVINNGRVFERNKVSDTSLAQSDRVLNKMDIEGGAPPAPRPLQPPALLHLAPPLGKAHKKNKIVPETQTGLNRKPVAHSKGGAFLNVDKVTPPSHHITREGVREPEKSKKLIIEDFVEVNNEHTTEEDKMFVQRHKHKRGQRPAPPPHGVTPQKHAKDNSEMIRNDGDSEMLDAPLLDDNVKEDWSIGESRMRLDRHNSVGSGEGAPPGPGARPRASDVVRGARPPYPPVVGDLLPDIAELQASVRAGERQNHPRGQGRHEARHQRRHETGGEDTRQATVDTDLRYNDHELTAFEPRYSRAQANSSSGEESETESLRRGEEGAPVKLVMRSNLTFNLGDEFFTWKNKATEDIVNEFINELSIPTNYSQYGEGDGPLAPAEGTPPTYSGSEDDRRTTASRGQRRTRTPQRQRDSHQSSSSEESGDDSHYS